MTIYYNHGVKTVILVWLSFSMQSSHLNIIADLISLRAVWSLSLFIGISIHRIPFCSRCRFTDFLSLLFSHSWKLLLFFLVISCFEASVEGTLPYPEDEGLTLLDPPSYPSAPSYPSPPSYPSIPGDLPPYLPSEPSFTSPPSYPSTPSIRSRTRHHSPPSSGSTYSPQKCALIVPAVRTAGPALKPLHSGLQYVNNYLSR